METVVTFTVAQIVAACTAFSAFCLAVNWIIKGIRKMREPGDRQDDRLTRLESRVARHDELLDKDKRRIEVLEEGNRVTQQALLALLGHGIDGNNVEQMQIAKDSLQKYLIER